MDEDDLEDLEETVRRSRNRSIKAQLVTDVMVMMIMMMIMNLEDGFLSLSNLRTILLTVSTFPLTLYMFEEDR
jgi:hypothetical protein